MVEEEGKSSMDFLLTGDGVSPCVSAHANDHCAWSEWMMEHILLLAPELIGVEDDLALRVDGGGTEGSPDQLYINEAGRLTVVEIKNECARLNAVAQLLGYSEHLAPRPWGELERTFMLTTIAKPLSVRRTEAQATVAALAARADPTKPPPVKRPPYLDNQSSIEDAALKKWGSPFWLTHFPNRLILVARSFDDDVVAFANALLGRNVDIRLIAADLTRGQNDLILTWRDVSSSHADSDLMSSAMSALMADASIRERTFLNGWFEHRAKLEASLSLKTHWPIRLYLKAHGEDICLSTEVPHMWSSTNDRPQWTARLRSQLPNGGDAWVFKWPDENARFVQRARECLDVLEAVLGSQARSGRQPTRQ